MSSDESARDSQRSKVYAAEEFVRTLFDRAAEHGSNSVEFFGAQLTLPPEARFGSLDAVQRYVDDVLALPAVRRRVARGGALESAGTTGRYCSPLRKP